MAHSLLLIPVPEAEFVIRPRLQLHPAALDETAAHITLLGPFADLSAIDHGLVSELRVFFADVLPFAFRLAGISQFPDGTAYLSPEPAGPFRQLTHELFERFPEFPPYGGAFGEVIPHLSVPTLEDEDVDGLRFGLGPRLPINAHAREAALFWCELGASRTLETFTFGTTAA